jgi:hypothetical protein
MEKKQITFERLQNLNISAGEYLSSLPKGKKTKLSYAIDKISRSVQKGINKYSQMIADLRSDHAATDENGFLIIHEGKSGNDRYSFSPEKEKALRKAIVALGDEKIEIGVHITNDVPNKDLSFNQIEDFRGILIPEDYEFNESMVDEIKTNEEQK